MCGGIYYSFLVVSSSRFEIKLGGDELNEELASITVDADDDLIVDRRSSFSDDNHIVFWIGMLNWRLITVI